MESGWNFTPGRVALLYGTGVVLGGSVALGVLGSPGNFVGAIAMVFSGLATVISCRAKHGNIAHPS